MADKAQFQVKPEFIVNLRGKDFVLYAGLLDLAHQKGIRRLETELVQLPAEANGNECVVKATLELKDGGVYTDYGDANPTNVNRPIAAHIIRMASTRAKARVLRDSANVGLTALEELGSLEEDEGHATVPAAAPAMGGSRPRAVEAPRAGESGNDAPRGIKMTDAQLRAIRSIARSKGMTPQAIEEVARRQFNTPLESLNIDEASHVIKELQRI